MALSWKRENKDTLEAEQKSELKHPHKLEKAHEILLIKHGLLKKHPILFRSKKEKLHLYMNQAL